jgi:LacI family transcriptional regulator
VYHARNFEYPTGAEAILRWMAAGIEFDGVAAQSDQQAVAAFNTLISAGKKVPDEVRLIGVDNSPFCELNSVRLSSVSQEDRLRARRAMQLLLDAIEGRPIGPVLIEPMLYVRESSL